MIDKLTYWLPEVDSRSVTARLLDAREIVSHKTGLCRIYGEIGPLKVRLDGGGMRIQTNVPNAVHGTKLRGVTRTEYIQAIRDWSDLLSIDIASARIRKLEICVNISLSKTVRTYSQHMGRLPRYQRFPYIDGLCYKQQQSEFAIYDKVREVRKKDGPIPEEFIGANIARSELRLKNSASIKRLLGRDVTLEGLAELEMWERTADAFAGVYDTIQYVPIARLPELPLTKNSMCKILAAWGAKDERLTLAITNAIENETDRQKRGRLRHDLYALQSGNDVGLIHSPLRDEFDHKVRMELQRLVEG